MLANETHLLKWFLHIFSNVTERNWKHNTPDSILQWSCLAAGLATHLPVLMFNVVTKTLAFTDVYRTIYFYFFKQTKIKSRCSKS